MGKVLAENLDRLFTKAGYKSQRRVAELAGISPTTLNYYTSGSGFKRDSLPAHIARKLEPVLVQRGVSPDEIWTLTEVSSNVHKVRSVASSHVPLLGTVQAGEWGSSLRLEADDIAYVEFPAVTRRAHGYDNTFLLEVRGSSMDLKLPDGCLIECVQPPEFNGQIATGLYVVSERENRYGEFETTVKQLEIRNDEFWLWPRSSDPSHQQPMRIPPASEWEEGDGEIRIIGVVVFVHGAPPP